MNAIRQLREESGLTQAELAARAGTSQSAIAAYETGRKSPTLRTLSRLAGSVGLEAWVEFHPPLTREDRRSLFLHRAIAARLLEDPDAVLAQARRVLAVMAGRRSPGLEPLLREWRVILDRPVPAIASLLLDPDPWARELRQTTPFAGVLDAAERREVYLAFRDEERRAS